MRKDIGDYIICSDGRIFSKKTERYLRPTLVKGYCYVDLGKETKVVHRLIAKSFIPNPNNLPQVNHKNGIKTDNRVENLEWCTCKHNINHAITSGLRIQHRGAKCNASKLTQHQVDRIREIYIPRKMSERKLASIFNVSRGAIHSILIGRTWS